VNIFRRGGRGRAALRKKFEKGKKNGKGRSKLRTPQQDEIEKRDEMAGAARGISQPEGGGKINGSSTWGG